jgi:hypothetical protein
MVSGKERLRLSRAFDKQAEAMERQKKAITRMTLMLTEASAALFEIAAHEGALDGMRDRAQAALDRMEVIRSSGNDDDGEESKEA